MSAIPDNWSTPEFEALVSDHQRELWRYLRYLGCAADEAEDVAQDVFLAVYARPFERRSRTATAGYLRRAAHRFLLQRRRRGELPTATDIEIAERVWIEHGGGTAETERAAALDACASELPEPARRLLALRYEQHLSRDQIASRLGIAEEGVKSRLRRVLARLRACVERRMLA